MSKIVNNERVKLVAATINAGAIACIGTGGITPVISMIYGLPLYQMAPYKLFLYSVLFIAFGIMLHLVALHILGRMEE